MQASWVAKWKDYRAVDVLSHFLDDFLGKGFGFSRGAYEYVRLYFLDHRKKIVVLPLLPLVVFSSKIHLRRRELVAVRLHKKTRFVHAPKMFVISIVFKTREDVI